MDSDQYDIARRKNELIKRIPSLDNSKIIIAKKEIESWYIAGVTPSLSKDRFKGDTGDKPGEEQVFYYGTRSSISGKVQLF